MYDGGTRKKLQDIIGGVIIKGESNHCTNARNYLCKSFSASTTVKKEFEYWAKLKEKQSKILKKYAADNDCLFTKIPDGSQYLT